VSNLPPKWGLPKVSTSHASSSLLRAAFSFFSGLGNTLLCGSSSLPVRPWSARK